MPVLFGGFEAEGIGMEPEKITSASFYSYSRGLDDVTV